MSRVFRAGAVFLLAVLGLGARTLDASEILRRAEDVRNPDVSYAADFAIHSSSGRGTTYEWDASYSMAAGGKDHTIILMRSPASFYGGVVLLSEGRYWMLLPRATKPLELSGAQVIRGDVSSGDLARSNLLKGYEPVLDGEETLDGESCFRLDLRRTVASGSYSRIVYWIAKKGFLPARLDQYGNTGRLLKTVRYGDYRRGAIGLRSMTIVIESIGDWVDRTTLTFSNLRKFPSDVALFTPEGIAAVRDAALAAGQSSVKGPVPLERIVESARTTSRPAAAR